MNTINFKQLLKLPLPQLICKSDKVRNDFIGSELEICNIVNAKSGLCNQDCKFCAQSTHYSTDISTYPLIKKAEIVKSAQRAKQIGADRFGIVISGKGPTMEEIDIISEAINKIRYDLNIEVCASLGKMDQHKLLTLKQAGLSRYHHNIETSPRFYPNIVSTHRFKERLKTIESAKYIGLEVCSGGIIGMGENWEDRVNMARILNKLNVDSVSINILVPIKGTPLERKPCISINEVIKTISIFRLILKDKIIKIAAGRESVLKDSQISGFMAGANGMLIGGYLTIKGRSIEQDYRLINQIKNIWAEENNPDKS